MKRIESLDQFRGYTVLAMFFVNFVGSFAALHPVFKHHNTYCSYADTIMPQFFFAVGFAYRLTLTRRIEKDGAPRAFLRALRRNLGLVLLGIVVYQLDGGARNWADLQRLGWSGFLAQAFQRNVFQTLVHIGVTAIWIMPAIAARPGVRVAFLVAGGLLHLGLSDWWYYHWAMRRPVIDGGPLGFLTWAVPTLVGSLACDAVTLARRPPVVRLLAWGAALAVLGYALANLNLLASPGTLTGGARAPGLVEPPFVPPTRPVNLWTMSQRAGSLSYQVFGAGFSLAVYALFVLACDLGRLRLGVFRTLGTNALAGYLLHDLVGAAFKPWTPKDSPLHFALAVTGAYLVLCWLFLRHLEKHEIYLRL